MFKVSRRDISVVPLTLPSLEDRQHSASQGGPAERMAAEPSPSLAEIELEIARARAERELASTRAEAEAILSAARSEAEAILDDAAREAGRAREEAEKRGYNEGYADGAEKVARDGEAATEARLRELDEKNRESIGNLFSSVNRELDSARAALAESVRELSMSIARRIVGEALREDDNLRLMINTAVSGLDAERGFTVRLAPETAERLFPDGSVTLTADGRAIRATVIPDVTLTEHGLLIDFGGGDRAVRADAGAQTQLDAVNEALSKLEEGGNA